MCLSPTYPKGTCHLTRLFASHVRSCSPALLRQTKIPKFFSITQIEFFYNGINKNNKPPPRGGGIASGGGFSVKSKSNNNSYAPITAFARIGTEVCPLAPTNLICTHTFAPVPGVPNFAIYSS